MITLGLYLITVLAASAGLMGHTTVLASLTQRTAAWAAQRADQGRRRAPIRRVLSWARKERQR